MRNMSFWLTTQQVRDQTKDITRRLGWWFLYPDYKVNAVVKAMGLKKGEKIEFISLIGIVSTRPEPLSVITQKDVVREGFPDWTPKIFIEFICDHYKIEPAKIVNRIEFKYISLGG